MKEKPYKCKATMYKPSYYTLKQLAELFPKPTQKEKKPTHVNQPLKFDNSIDLIDFKEIIIRAYASVGIKAEFDPKDRVIEDGRLTGTFKSQQGDFLASTSHDPKEGNRITATAMIKGCTNKEAAEWIKEEFNLKKIVRKKSVKEIKEHNALKGGDLQNEGRKEFTPYTWGKKKLDDKIWALKRYQYCLIAGITNSGKTAYAFDLARKNAELGHKVLYFVLEMSVEDLQNRFACEKAGVTIGEDRMEDLPEDKKKIYKDTKKYLQGIENLKLIEVPRDVKPTVLIDNLDKISRSQPSQSEYDKQTEASESFVRFTNSEKIPIILVHHINIKKTKDYKDNGLNVLRGSGKVADDADIALFVSRDIDPESSEEEKARLYVDVKKQRRSGEFLKTVVYHKEGIFYDEYNPDDVHLNPAWWNKGSL